MADDTSDFEKKLAAIRLSYLTDALPEQLQAVQSSAEHFNRAVSNTDLNDALTVLHATSHKLAGSSGTFGLENLSAAARVLSDFTDDADAMRQANIETYKTQITNMVDAVMSAERSPDKCD